MRLVDEPVEEVTAEDELLDAIARVIREADEARPTLRVLREGER